MSSKNVYFLMLGLAAVFVAVILGGTYEINALLAHQSQKLVGAKAKDAALQQEQIQLNGAKKDIATYNDLYQISKVVVPQSKNQTEAVRQIVGLAAQTGIDIQSISFPASTLGGGGSSSSSSAAAGAGSTSAAKLGPSATTGGNPSLSQLTKVSNIPGVYVLQLVVSSNTHAYSSQTDTFQEMINFLSKLEQNRLTALVSNITISPGGATTGSSSANTPTNLLQFELTLNIYIKP